jgi:hypothetical protein
VVEKNAAGAEDAIAFPVVHGHPMGVQLRNTVGAARVEWGFLNLGNRLHLAKHLGCAGLVEPDVLIEQANGFQQVQGPKARDLGCCRRLVETDADKALCREIVNFRRLGFCTSEMLDPRSVRSCSTRCRCG